jgi:hypothetical protein
LATVRITDCNVKEAVTDVAEVRLTVQEPAPVHPPLHSVKVEPACTTAVRVTEVPYE